MVQKLGEITLPVKVVELSNGQSFEVRGISFGDITAIMNSHAAEAVELYDIVRKRGGSITDSEVKLIIGELIPKFPSLLGMIICVAADDVSDQAMKIALKLSAMKQAQILQDIFELSLTSEAEVKKMLESITDWIQKIAVTLAQARLHTSENGSGAFVDK